MVQTMLLQLSLNLEEATWHCGQFCLFLGEGVCFWSQFVVFDLGVVLEMVNFFASFWVIFFRCLLSLIQYVKL